MHKKEEEHDNPKEVVNATREEMEDINDAELDNMQDRELKEEYYEEELTHLKSKTDGFSGKL